MYRVCSCQENGNTRRSCKNCSISALTRDTFGRSWERDSVLLLFIFFSRPMLPIFRRLSWWMAMGPMRLICSTDAPPSRLIVPRDAKAPFIAPPRRTRAARSAPVKIFSSLHAWMGDRGKAAPLAHAVNPSSSDDRPSYQWPTASSTGGARASPVLLDRRKRTLPEDAPERALF